MDKYTGKVKYLNKEHGFGYISLCEDPGREHGDINFSTSDPGCHSLSLGDIVTLDIRKGNSINKNGKICEYAVSVQLNESVSRPMTSYYQHKTDKESMQGNRELKQAICNAISSKIGTSCQLHFYDSEMPFRCDRNSDNPWMIGHPDCAIYTEDKLMQATLRTNSLFNNTISGKDSYMTYENPDKSKFRRTIHVPAYGCPSFLFNKDLCFLMIEFACRSGIDLSHYEIIFVDKDEHKTDVYTMTLDKLQQLIESGYKYGNKYVPLGEYPNTPKYKGNCTMRYLLPVDAFEKLPVAK